MTADRPVSTYPAENIARDVAGRCSYCLEWVSGVASAPPTTLPVTTTTR